MRRNNEVLSGESDAAFAVAAAVANILILIVSAATLWIVQVLYNDLIGLEVIVRRLEII